MVMANVLDCLLLPVISIITASSVYRPGRESKLHDVKISDLFSYCPMDHFLFPKAPTELVIGFKYIGAIFHKHIRTDSAIFEPFFLRCLQSFFFLYIYLSFFLSLFISKKLYLYFFLEQNINLI